MFDPEFIRLLTDSVGNERAQKVLEALTGEPSTSVRMNPLKMKSCPFEGAAPIPWSPYGYFLPQRPVFTLDPLFHAGCYYVQESSAMMAGHIFRKILPLLPQNPRVLDLCAAPGGKTTDLAASLRDSFGDSFSLLANEVMKNRYGVLRSNVETWGDSRVGTVSRDPSAFGDAPVFDAILADVPCSGEGMFRKDPTAVKEWTSSLPDFCAARSRRILRDIWPTLREGGFLIFSTCTFNRIENDDTVSRAAAELGADIIPPESCSPAISTENGYLMLPGYVPGEGQYVALLQKKGSADSPVGTDPLLLFNATIPAPRADDLPHWDVDRETALQYLRGNAIKLSPDAPSGLVYICYRGQVLGQGKNIGQRCNNLYPKGKRIRTL